MLDRLRTSLHRVIATPVGDGFVGVRVPKDLARRVNVMLGEPIASEAELERRRAARARLEELKKAGSAATSSSPREAAPVMVYFEKDRNARMLERIKDLLDSKRIAFTALEVDETTKDYVMREARVKEDELPVVFIAAAPVGGYNELVDWDVSGRLATAVWGKSDRA
ncbi:MAG: hypothetical protein JST00_23555 [Deltaproteobacteria bacterium]|nr:hypothetical protein [Deltaproteobacteria bacterium]